MKWYTTPLKRLSHALATGQTRYELQFTSPGLRKFAAYAYVAEQFGYRYAGPTTATRTFNQPLIAFERAADLQERATQTAARYPAPTWGGPLPGMEAGRGLRPSKPVMSEVALLHSRMIVDACERYNRRVLRNLLVLLLAVAVFLFFPGYTVQHILIGGAAWFVLFMFYLAGLGVSRIRLARHRKRLTAAGISWPPPRTEI